MVGIPSLDQIRYLGVLAEERHFGNAAARLGITQPSLSQQIARLEDLLGFEVVLRRPAFAITPAGRVFLEAVGQMPARIEAAATQAARVADGMAGVVRVGFAGSVMLTPVARLVRDFRRSHPDVAVELTESPTATLITRLQHGDVDLAIAREPQLQQYDELDGIVLLKERFVVAVPASHEKAHVRELSIADLRDEGFVLFPRDTTPGLHAQITRLFARHGFLPNVVQEATELFTILALVDAGAGISVVPESFRRLGWGSVRYIPLSTGKATTQVVLCWRIEDVSAAATQFIKGAKRRPK